MTTLVGRLPRETGPPFPRRDPRRTPTLSWAPEVSPPLLGYVCSFSPTSPSSGVWGLGGHGHSSPRSHPSSDGPPLDPPSDVSSRHGGVSRLGSRGFRRTCSSNRGSRSSTTFGRGESPSRPLTSGPLPHGVKNCRFVYTLWWGVLPRRQCAFGSSSFRPTCSPGSGSRRSRRQVRSSRVDVGGNLR